MSRYKNIILRFIIILLFLHVAFLEEILQETTSERPLSGEIELLNELNVTSESLENQCINTCMKSEFSNNETCYETCTVSQSLINVCADSCTVNDTLCADSCTTFQCPDQCRCQEVEDLVDIECNDFTVRLQPREILAIVCKNNSLQFLPDFKLIINASIPYVRFIDCPLPSSSFSSVISLEGKPMTLSLRNFKGNLNKNHLKNLNNLTRLDLAYNKLEYLPEDLLTDLPLLTCLDLNDNNIKNLSADLFQYLPNLEQLYLDNNQLVRIPSDIFANLSKLWLLSLWGNKLDFANSSTFTGLVNLQHLDLSNNKFAFFLHNTFSELKSLQSLDISYNRFEIFSMSLFQDLHKLTNVKINGNSKKESNTTDVEWIKGNAFELVLPNYLFATMMRLKSLSISESGLLQLPRFIIQETESLLELDFHGNSLTTLPRFMLQHTKKLKSLDISDNAITELPYDLFSELALLRELKVNGNLLNKLPRSFHIYAGLEVFQLHNCSFSSIPSTMVRQLKRAPNLRLFTISGNPWLCDCEAVDFIKVAQIKALDLHKTTCQDGRNFSQLTYDDLCPTEIVSKDIDFHEQAEDIVTDL